MRVGGFSASGEFARTREVDVAVLCVPRPLNRYREPDLSSLTNTAHAILDCVRPDQLLVLGSTTYPGTTRDLSTPIYRRRGLALGRDVFLAHSPEREDPGNAEFETSTIPKVIGADGKIGRDLAVSLLWRLCRQGHSGVVDRLCGGVNLTGNIFRAVSIARVDELKRLYAAMGIEI